MMPIAQRLLRAKNDARVAGKQPVRARISPQDKVELESWVRQQNRTSIVSGLPTQVWSASNVWDMDIVEDARVRHTFILEFEPK